MNTPTKREQTKRHTNKETKHTDSQTGTRKARKEGSDGSKKNIFDEDAKNDKQNSSFEKAIFETKTFNN